MPESCLTIDTRTWSQPLGFFLDFFISYVQVHAFLSDEWKEQNNQSGSKKYHQIIGLKFSFMTAQDRSKQFLKW